MPDNVNPVTPQLTSWAEHLETRFVERGVPIRLMLLALLSQQHLLLLGPPGVAKSMLATAAGEVIDGQVFTRLLTKFSGPEELFGPFCIKGLEAGRYGRQTAGWLPTAEVAFLDEIFKANSSILNALLTILNEREFDNGTRRVKVPLRTVVAASNEVPEREDGLDALDDRLLLRVMVESVTDQGFGALLRMNPTAAPSPLTKAHVDTVCAQAERIGISPEAERAIRSARHQAREQLSVSDRRWLSAVELMKVMAVVDGLEEVSLCHLGVLAHVLWRRPEERTKAHELLGWLLDDIVNHAITAAAEELEEQLADLKRQLDDLARQQNGYYPGYGHSIDPAEQRSELTHKVEQIRAAVAKADQTRMAAVASPSGLWDSFWSCVSSRASLALQVDQLLRHPALETQRAA